MRLESGGAHHWLASECGFLRATRNRIKPLTTGRFVGHGSFSFDRRLHSESGKKFAQNSPNGKKPLSKVSVSDPLAGFARVPLMRENNFILPFHKWRSDR